MNDLVFRAQPRALISVATGAAERALAAAVRRREQERLVEAYIEAGARSLALDQFAFYDGRYAAAADDADEAYQQLNDSISDRFSEEELEPIWEQMKERAAQFDDPAELARLVTQDLTEQAAVNSHALSGSGPNTAYAAASGKASRGGRER